ncbi:MAG: hypothetical protein JETT_0046 [Candidatus Jettenia ecosi]|uniref:Uncharacterized protein n=1 Tax=Candidatus Jettenia ecosi TaxID=2494326 RepID=A0A533QFQ5_9BACT|nr:MAG: hypothetical protein JETT_0046 [Candidatus Jettenia ecosi]
MTHCVLCVFRATITSRVVFCKNIFQELVNTMLTIVAKNRAE